MLKQPAPVRATPALQLWEAFHESKALAVSLKSAARAQSDCKHLSELLESVSELLCFVFSRYKDILFVGTLNSHVQSSAQLLHFGLLKVCRVVDSCRGNSSNPTPFSQASITSTAASAAADIQLAVTVLATAVQYLEATRGKRSEAAATQVSCGPHTSQQAPLLLKGAAAAASIRRSVGSQRQLAGDAQAVEIYSTAAPSLAGRDGTVTAGGRYRDSCRSETYEQQPEVVAELTFGAKNGAYTVVGEQIATLDERLAGQQQCFEVESCKQQTGVLDQQHALNEPAEGAIAKSEAAKAQLEATITDDNALANATAAEPVESAAYTTARLQALHELLKPGSTWCLEDSGANFVCSTSSNSQQQQEVLKESETSADCQQSRPHSLQQQELPANALPPAADAFDAAGEMPVVGDGQDEFDPVYCSDIQSTKVPLTAEELQRDEQEQQQQWQSEPNQEEQVSSTTWLQQQLQQVYSNTLLQDRKQQQARRMMLRRSKELSQGVAAVSEVLPSPKEQLQQLLQRKQQARAESPEPAGWGIGFVSAGYNSRSGSCGRSLRMSTEELVDNVLGRSVARRAASVPGGDVSAAGHGAAAGMLAAASYAASASAASEGFFVPYMKAVSPDKSPAAGEARGSSAPGSVPGSTRASRDIGSTVGSTRTSRDCGSTVGSTTPVFPASSAMVSSSSPRGYANRSGSYTSRSASAAGSLRNSRDYSQSGSTCNSLRSTGVRGSNTRESGDYLAAAAATSGSTNGGTSGSNSSPGSLRTTRNSSAAGAAGHAPHRYSNTGSSRQNRVSKDSILSSSPCGVILSSSGAGSGISGGLYYSYDEALTAAAASYATARSSFSGSGLVRYSSTGSAVVQGTSSSGSALQFRVSRGEVKEPESCRVTSAAGATVINMLAAAAAGAEVAAVDSAAAGVTRSAAVVGSNVDWLCSSGSTSVQQSRRCSYSGRSSSCDDGVVQQLLRRASCPDEQALPDDGAARGACVTAHGCLTLGSCRGCSTPGSSNGSRSPARASSGACTSPTRRSSFPSGLGGSSTGNAGSQVVSPPASSGGRRGRSSSNGTTRTAELLLQQQQQQQQQQDVARPASRGGQRDGGSSNGTTRVVEQQQQQAGSCPVGSGYQCSSTPAGSNIVGAKASQQQHFRGQFCSQAGEEDITIRTAVDAMSEDDGVAAARAGSTADGPSVEECMASAHTCSEASSGRAADHTAADSPAGSGPAAEAQVVATAAADIVPLTALEAAIIAAATQDTKQGRKASAASVGSLSVGIAASAAAVCQSVTNLTELHQPQEQQQQDKEEVADVVGSQQAGVEQQQKRKQDTEAPADSTTATSCAAGGAKLDAWQRQRQQWQQQWEQQQQLWQQQVQQHTEGKIGSASAVVSREDSRWEEASDATQVAVQGCAAVQEELRITDDAAVQEDTAVQDDAAVQEEEEKSQEDAAQGDTTVQADAAVQEDMAVQEAATLPAEPAAPDDAAVQEGIAAQLEEGVAVQKDKASQADAAIKEDTAVLDVAAVHETVAAQDEAAVQQDTARIVTLAEHVAAVALPRPGMEDSPSPAVLPEAAVVLPEAAVVLPEAAVVLPEAAVAAALCDDANDADFGEFQSSHGGATSAAVSGSRCGDAEQIGEQHSQGTQCTLHSGGDQCYDSTAANAATAAAAMVATATGELRPPHNRSSTVEPAVLGMREDGILHGMQSTGASDESANRSSLMVHSSVTTQQQQQQQQQQQNAAQAGSYPAAAAAGSVLAATPEAAAEALLAEGNAAYTAGRYNLAVQSYARALDQLGGSIASISSAAGVLLWVKCSLNLACTNLRLGQYKQCVAICDGLLEVDPANIVALCHRGRALLMVQQLAAAKADLTEALHLLEDEAAEQQHQQQHHLAQQQQQLLGQATGTPHESGVVSAAGEHQAVAAAAGQGNCVSLSSATVANLACSSAASEVDGAIRGSCRCLTPCTLARMRLNNSYWQHRVMELLSSIKD